jgi:hypothetical protein
VSFYPCRNAIYKGLALANLANSRLGGLLKRLLLRRPEQSPVPPPPMEQQWSIGIYSGNSPFDFVPHPGASNPVLTHRNISDVRAGFIADPFMVQLRDDWFMFFEVWNLATRKGEIGVASSKNGVSWQYLHIALAEPFHLSYPYVFEWENEYYMIPESYHAGSIRLYRAVAFPTGWSLVGEILAGPYFVDASVFPFNSKWWCFTETNPEFKCDTLRLFYADDLHGPWREHPKSPLIQGDARIARPAGRVLILGDRVIRYAQDCSREYGEEVRALEVTELTPTSYREHEIRNNPVLAAGNALWNQSGMHHLDPHPLADGCWFACVDGWHATPTLGSDESVHP